MAFVNRLTKILSPGFVMSSDLERGPRQFAIARTGLFRPPAGGIGGVISKRGDVDLEPREKGKRCERRVELGCVPCLPKSIVRPSAGNAPEAPQYARIGELGR